MSDRWNSKLRTVEVVRPPKFFVPSGESTGLSSVEPRGKTWGIRERGDIESTVRHSYRCPVHGLFDVDVPRADVPDAVECTVRYEPRMFALFGADSEERERIRALHICRESAPWAGSFCGQGHAAGEVMS